jgi:hypothetical protein
MNCCEPAGPGPGIDPGMLALRGERDLLQLPASEPPRLRYNPFCRYLEHRAQLLTGLAKDIDNFCLSPGPAGKVRSLKHQA